MKSVLKVLRLVDGDKKPTIGFLYEAIKLMKDTVKDVAYRSSKGYLKIIKERWSKMFLHILHEASEQFDILIYICHNYVYTI